MVGGLQRLASAAIGDHNGLVFLPNFTRLFSCPSKRLTSRRARAAFVHLLEESIDANGSPVLRFPSDPYRCGHAGDASRVERLCGGRSSWPGATTRPTTKTPARWTSRSRRSRRPWTSRKATTAWKFAAGSTARASGSNAAGPTPTGLSRLRHTRTSTWSLTVRRQSPQTSGSWSMDARTFTGRPSRARTTAASTWCSWAANKSGRRSRTSPGPTPRRSRDRPATSCPPFPTTRPMNRASTTTRRPRSSS